IAPSDRHSSIRFCLSWFTMPGDVERWPPLAALRLRQALDDVCKLVKNPEFDLDRNLEVHQSLCRFLVVRSCGYLETSTIEICRAYVYAKSGGPVRSFAHSWLERSGNPNPGYLMQLIGRFDSSMANEFEHFILDDDSRIKRDIDFLVSRRNRIAHGESEGIN